MSRFVSPALDQLDKLRQPLTPGERMVVDLFHTELPEDWEIYIQPHLNGLRPDIVLLNPKVGIAVFEVKDWNLGAMEYRVEVSSCGLKCITYLRVKMHHPEENHFVYSDVGSCRV